MGRWILRILVLALLVAVLPPLLADTLGWGPSLEALPGRGKTVELEDGRLIHLHERGSGVPVIFVHGLPSNAADWGDVPERLVSLGNYRSIAYDRIGYGYSSREPAAVDPFTLESNARELGALLDALGIEKAALVGWSYGGEVIQRFAEEAPHRVSHLVFVGSPSSSPIESDGSALDAVLHSPFGPSVLKWAGSIPPLSDKLTRDSLNLAFARPESVPDGFVEYTQALLSLPGTAEAFAAEVRNDDPASLRPEALSIPALVIHGADDYLVPYPMGEDLDRRLPDSEFVTVLDGSHMLPLTHAELLAEKIHELIGAW